jgi:hypothetical protein
MSFKNSLSTLAITIIALLCAAALLFNVEYVQSIGFPVEKFSELVLSSLPPMKLRLSKAEREAFTLTNESNEILVGLFLGDLSAEKQNVNVRLKFYQGIEHKDYLLHLFEKFSDYCRMAPKTIIRAPDKRTGKLYSSIYFNTLSLPCFNDLYV